MSHASHPSRFDPPSAQPEASGWRGWLQRLGRAAAAPSPAQAPGPVGLDIDLDALAPLPAAPEAARSETPAGWRTQPNVRFVHAGGTATPGASPNGEA